MPSFASELAPWIASRAAIAMSGLSVRTASIESSDWSLDWISVSVVWMSLTPLTWRFSTSPPKPFFAPSQRWLSPMLDCSWMTHSSLVAPASLNFLPGALAGDRLGLADVRDRPERLIVVGARVQRDDRDAGVGRLLERVAERVGVRGGGRDPVDLLRHRRVDQLRLLLRIVGGLGVLHRHAQLLAGVLGALLRDGPERVALAVRDHGDGRVLALGQVHVVARGRRAAGPAAAGVVVPAAGRGERREPEHHQHRRQRESQLPHHAPLPRPGALSRTYSMLACTSSTGPLPTGGSSPVSAASCSSTSQRSYP